MGNSIILAAMESRLLNISEDRKSCQAFPLNRRKQKSYFFFFCYKIVTNRLAAESSQWGNQSREERGSSLIRNHCKPDFWFAHSEFSTPFINTGTSASLLSLYLFPLYFPCSIMHNASVVMPTLHNRPDVGMMRRSCSAHHRL